MAILTLSLEDISEDELSQITTLIQQRESTARIVREKNGGVACSGKAGSPDHRRSLGNGRTWRIGVITRNTTIRRRTDSRS
jgi:hypothetical protein